MSVIASRPDRVAMPYNTIPHESHIVHGYKDSAYTVSIHSVPSRKTSISSSVSSYSTNYSQSTAPTIYSPTSPTSPSLSHHFFKASTPPPKQTEPVLKRLPQEVYDCVLNQLELEHTSSHKSGCLTCFQRDLHALALTSRAWEKAVRSKLYNRIHVIGNDSPAQLKKYRLKRGSRLKLLRRTLRERKLLANLVLELRVPEIDLLLLNGRQGAQLQEYRDLVASVVMVCPNLERLLGFTVPYHYEFDRLTYALSTRRKLKEHTWIFGDTTEVADRPRSQSLPESLEQHQVFEFLNYHASWTNLDTLMLHSLNVNGLVGHGVFLRMFNLLPSLRHLCISSFSADAFTDRTLLFLPFLESLRLENLSGITDTGLAQYASRKEAHSLKSLTLVEQNIKSLLAISKILASLRQLERFNIVQTTTCPTLQSGGMVFQPLLASASLKQLHWDVGSPDPVNALSKFDSAPFVKPPRHSETPNSHLAQSILHSGFPRLETLRAPSDIDPPGVLQAVCQPLGNGQALVPSDRYSLPRSSHGSVNTKPLALPGGNNLTSARIRAQTFIDMAAKDTETGMKVLVTDHSDSYVPDNALDYSDDESDFDLDEFGERIPSGERHNIDLSDTADGPVKVHEFRMPAYMGRVGGPNSFRDVSVPQFVLHPDTAGADADGGLVGWRHLLATNQSLTYAAGVGMNTFGNRSTSPGIASSAEEPLSPASSTSRFGGWGSIGGRSGMAASPITPITPLTPSFPSSAAPPWARDSCTGHWNHTHDKGKDWWFHIERDRPGNIEIVEPKQFF